MPEMACVQVQQRRFRNQANGCLDNRDQLRRLRRVAESEILLSSSLKIGVRNFQIIWIYLESRRFSHPHQSARKKPNLRKIVLCPTKFQWVIISKFYPPAEILVAYCKTVFLCLPTGFCRRLCSRLPDPLQKLRQKQFHRLVDYCIDQKRSRSHISS